MKKIFFLLITLCLVFTASACSEKSTEKDGKAVSHLLESDDENQAEEREKDTDTKSDEKADEAEEKSTVSFPKNVGKAKRAELEKTAEEIEKYAEENLDTAQSQSEMNLQSYEVFNKWDALLNEIYGYLKSSMSKSDFEALQKDEIEWIKEKEAAIEEAAKEWRGGTGEHLARNTAGILYTKARCEYLMSLID